jgi:hypothetical protein
MFVGAGSAIAQTPTDHLKLDVTRAELQIIGQGLMELPYKTSAPVLTILQQQLNAIDAKAAADKAAADKSTLDEKTTTKPAK